MTATDTMALWNSVCETDPKNTKSFKGKGGFQGTAICAQSQRKTATQLWGPFGCAWRITDESFHFEDTSDDFHDRILVYTGTLHYPFGAEFGNFTIVSEINVWTYSTKYKTWSRNNDIYKKVRTDALTKGLSELGFNSDVFEGKFDDNKYVSERRKEAAGAKVQEKVIKGDPNFQAAKPAGGYERVTDSQRKMLYAKAKSKKLSDDQLHAVVRHVAGVDSSKDIPKSKVNDILDAISNWTPEFGKDKDLQAELPEPGEELPLVDDEDGLPF